jgi:hypothetical protein
MDLVSIPNFPAKFALSLLLLPNLEHLTLGSWGSYISFNEDEDDKFHSDENELGGQPLV